MNIPEHVIMYAQEHHWGKLKFVGTDKGINYYRKANEGNPNVPTGLPSYLADDHGKVFVVYGIDALKLPF